MFALLMTLALASATPENAWREAKAQCVADLTTQIREMGVDQGAAAEQVAKAVDTECSCRIQQEVQGRRRDEGQVLCERESQRLGPEAFRQRYETTDGRTPAHRTD